MKNQFGRSMLEIIGVLAIISVLSVGGIYGYRTAMDKRKVNEILNTIQSRTALISSAMENKKFSTADEMNAFLAHFNTKVGRYNIAFEIPEDDEFDQSMYATVITDEDDAPIKGRLCRQLMRSMIEQKMISDIGVTIEDDENEDGSSESVLLHLNGLSVNLDAVCGSDSL